MTGPDGHEPDDYIDDPATAATNPAEPGETLTADQERQLDALMGVGSGQPDSITAYRIHEMLRTQELTTHLDAELTQLQEALSRVEAIKTNERVHLVHTFLRQWTLDLVHHADFVSFLKMTSLKAQRVIGAEEFAAMEYTHDAPVFLLTSGEYVGSQPRIYPKIKVALDELLPSTKHVLCQAGQNIYLIPCSQNDSDHNTRDRDRNRFEPEGLLKDMPDTDIAFRSDEREMKMIDVLAKMNYGDKSQRLIDTLCAVLSSDVIEEHQRKMFPEFKPYPPLKPSSSKERQQVNILEMFKNLPKPLREVVKKAKIAVLQLTEGCEQRCPTCSFNPKGRVTSEFGNIELDFFVAEYIRAFNNDTILYYGSDPLEYKDYVHILAQLVVRGLRIFTSTIAPHGHEDQFFKLAQLTEDYAGFAEHTGRDADYHKLRCRLSVMPQNFMRATVLAITHEQAFSRPPDEISDYTGCSLHLAKYKGIKAKTRPQGRAIRRGAKFDLTDLTGISCRRGIFITPETGVAQILPTIMTHASLKSRTGNIVIPVTANSDKILCATGYGGSPYEESADTIFLSPAEMYCKNERGRWVKRKMPILEAELARYFVLLHDVEDKCYGEGRRAKEDDGQPFTPYVPKIADFETAWDHDMQGFIDCIVADEQVPTITCFNETYFKQHIGEAVPPEYIRRLVAGIKMAEFFLTQLADQGENDVKKNFKAACRAERSPRSRRELAREIPRSMRMFLNRGKAVLKSLHKLGLIKPPIGVSGGSAEVAGRSIKLPIVG